MCTNPDVPSVFEFLRRNGFLEAESALRDDIVDRGNDPVSSLSSSSSVRFIDFTQLPTPPPPVRIMVGRRPFQLRETSADADNDSSSSSDSSSAFVSMGSSSPSDLVNPFGLWSATAQIKCEDESSDRLSEFGTAREYNDLEVLNDSFWCNDREGGFHNQPCFGSTDDSGCLSEDKFVMTIGAEDQFGKTGAVLNLVSGGFHSVTSINYSSEVAFTSVDDTSGDDGKGHLHSRILDTVMTPPCACCSGFKGYYRLGSEDADYGRSDREEVKESHIPLYGCCYELMSDDPKIFQTTELDELPSKLVDECPSAVFWEQNVTCHSLHGTNSSRNKQDFVSQFPEKELQMLDLMMTTRTNSTNGGSLSNHKSSRSSNYSNKRSSKVKIDDDKEFQQYSDSHLHNAEKASLPGGNDECERGDGGAMIIESEDNGTVRDTEENCIASELLMYDNQEEEYEIFDLRIIHRKNRTGFEENKDLPIVLNTIIAGRYYVTEYLGSAAFSKVIQAHDLQTGMDVCLKIIKNDKDFFDQSLDEIKLLKFVNKHDPVDERHILRLYDYFYHQEHLFIVCELLRANLYEFQKFNHESGGEIYFTLPRLQSITRQCLEALEYLHYLGIIHCDLKPENILIKSYSRCEIKVIDLGSSCFQTDSLCSYVQSRSYRAPEVILGLAYDKKIDIWSLGCILAELCSGDETDQLEYIIPEKSSLVHRLEVSDMEFIEFVRELLQTNPDKRPTATEALEHPWLSHPY
ncbi:uncharacterized protein LOC131253293 isoform X2 [Magnolia sinica]|uniref:uncharacterized protein LOC131253293 isoform X2 n=1 Tax=Magnolia sinica TaxID=86752 RepID=UPI0026583048|nr:uncharacterized protein LOC131253293 isoform X2 [Magnolia sinica]